MEGCSGTMCVFTGMQNAPRFMKKKEGKTFGKKRCGPLKCGDASHLKCASVLCPSNFSPLLPTSEDLFIQ